MDSSAASSDRFSEADSTIDSIDPDHTICKDLLRKQVFLGQFTEKKFLESIQDYRDLIVVRAQDPHDTFGRQLQFVKSRLQKKSPLIWVGITMSAATPTLPNCWNIWTKLPSGLPFGEYYFKVKSISFKHNEIQLKLKVVHDRSGREDLVDPSTQIQFSWEDFLATSDRLRVVAVAQLRSTIEWIRTREITFADVWLTLKYVAVIVLMIGTFAIQGIGMLGRFCLVLSAELRKLIHVLMPLLVRIVEFAEKCVGGLFIVITMMWRDTVNGIRSGQEGRREIRYQFQPIENRRYRPRY